MKIYLKKIGFIDPNGKEVFRISYLEIPFIQIQRGEKYNLGILLATVGEWGGLAFINFWPKRKFGSPEWILNFGRWEEECYDGNFSQSNIFIYRGDGIIEMIHKIIGHRYRLRERMVVDSYTVPSGFELKMWNYLKKIIYVRTVNGVAYDSDLPQVFNIKHFCLQVEEGILNPYPKFQHLSKGNTMFEFEMTDEFFSHTHPFALDYSVEFQNLPVLSSPHR